MIRFDKSAGEASFECRPRTVDVSDPEAEQFVGWPVKVPLRTE